MYTHHRRAAYFDLNFKFLSQCIVECEPTNCCCWVAMNDMTMLMMMICLRLLLRLLLESHCPMAMGMHWILNCFQVEWTQQCTIDVLHWFLVGRPPAIQFNGFSAVNLGSS